MNYELAKRLKDAGFSQRKMPESETDNATYRKYGYPMYGCPHGKKRCNPYTCPDKAYFPTLEELIEACREDLSRLDRVTKINGKPGWIAYMDKDVYMEDSTPSEAVANLWLALNSKPA